MKTVFIAILNMSMAASIVALAVMLIRWPLKKAPKTFSYMLWAVVFLRLVCPFNLESPNSLMPADIQLIPPTTTTEQHPQINTDMAVDEYTDSYISDGQPEQKSDESSGVLTAGATIWLCGLVALLLYAAISYIHLQRRVFDATRVEGNIYESDKIDTAFVLGFIAPRVFIPATVTGKRVDYMVMHERVHIRRLDHLIKPLAYLVLAIHWFNPIVWACYHLMINDMEMSCDEAVLRKAGADIRQDYAMSLLSLYTQPKLLSPLAFGEGSVRNMKARIKNVLNFRKTPVWAIMLCSFMVVLFTAGFATNPLSASIQESMYMDTTPDAAEDSYYSAHGSAAYEKINSNRLKRILSQWTHANLGSDIKNPKWNLDSFARYEVYNKNLKPVAGNNDLYYCTFSADDGKYGYAVLRYTNGNGGGLAQVRIAQTPYEYDLLATTQAIQASAKAAGFDTSTATATRVAIEDGGTRREAIHFTNGTGKAFTYYFDSSSGQATDSGQANDGGAVNNGTNDKDNSDSSSQRQDSLVESFAKYSQFGVVYDAERDAVFYNGQRVKLFVEFKSGQAEGISYAFDLCYHDSKTNSSIYLEAVKDSSGNITGIRQLDVAIARELLDSLNQASTGNPQTPEKPEEPEKPENNEKPENPAKYFVTMDGTQVLENYSITAKDTTIEKANVNVRKWVAGCTESQQGYIRREQSGSWNTTYIYYNGGGRYPWNMSVVDGALRIDMYSDNRFKTDDGYSLIYFVAPKDYTDIRLYLDGVEIECE